MSVIMHASVRSEGIEIMLINFVGRKRKKGVVLMPREAETRSRSCSCQEVVDGQEMILFRGNG